MPHVQLHVVPACTDACECTFPSAQLVYAIPIKIEVCGVVTSVRCYARGAVPNSCDIVPHLQSFSLLTYMPLAASASAIGRGGWLGHLQNLCMHVLMLFYTLIRATKTKT